MLFRPPQFLVRIARDSFLTALPTLRILPEFPRLFHSSKLFLPSDRRRKFGGARKPEAGSLSISHVLNVPKNILLLFNTTLQHNMPKRRDEHRSAVNRDNYKSDSSGDEQAFSTSGTSAFGGQSTEDGAEAIIRRNSAQISGNISTNQTQTWLYIFIHIHVSIHIYIYILP